MSYTLEWLARHSGKKYTEVKQKFDSSNTTVGRTLNRVKNNPVTTGAAYFFDVATMPPVLAGIVGGITALSCGVGAPALLLTYAAYKIGKQIKPDNLRILAHQKWLEGQGYKEVSEKKKEEAPKTEWEKLQDMLEGRG
jgi:hypothetical protein